MDTLRIRGCLAGQAHATDVLVSAGRVVGVEPAGRGRPSVGSRQSIIAPVLFDIQVNGVRGIDLQSGSLTADDVGAITDELAQCGVSRWVPTVITGSLDTMAHACETIASAMDDPAVGSAVPGIHIEGPYISPMDGPRGAHAKAFVRNPDVKEFNRLYRAARGRILYVTLAPELPGAAKFIRSLASCGIVVALGHHNGSAADIAAAVDAGARLCTHLGNGLASMIHRHVNPLWAQLSDDRLAAGLIADLEHLPAPALKTFVRAKRPGNVILTSDCVHIAGLPAGRYSLGTQAVELLPSGRICLSGTDLLAGSSLMLLQGVVNAYQVTDMTLPEALAAATTNPARLFGVKLSGLPKPGSKADFILFDIDKAGPRWKAVIRDVFVRGLHVVDSVS
jgi:N-acetylglucosamine-6-phosphate deacetylase